MGLMYLFGKNKILHDSVEFPLKMIEYFKIEMCEFTNFTWKIVHVVIPINLHIYANAKNFCSTDSVDG